MAKNYTPNQNNRQAYDTLTEGAATLPPQAVELEEAVLGALMLEGDSITTVQEFLTADAFYLDTHRIIYRAIEELCSENKPVDLLTVTEKLKRQKKLKEVGGAPFLAQLTQKVASAMNIEFHATIIAQKYVQRELIRASTEIQRRSYDESTDVTDLIDYAEAEIFKVSEGHIKRDIQSASLVFDKAMKAIEEAHAQGGTMNGVPTGFTRLDQLTLGWQPSDLIIIAARPSMGKTAFVLSMARNMAIDHEKPVAFFSLEMSSVQLMMRLIVAESGLSSADVRSGKLTAEQWRHLEQTTRILPTAPLFIDDTPALSIYELRSKARRLKAQHDIQIIIIDYLQLMTGNADSRGNREQEVASISRGLKSIAKELNIPIIALSQLNRSIESRSGLPRAPRYPFRDNGGHDAAAALLAVLHPPGTVGVTPGDKRPQLSDLRESGAIEQDADIVAFIHRPEYFGFTQDEDGNPTAGMAEIILAKHRNGATDTVKLRFRKEQARFLDYDDEAGTMIESSMNDDDYGSLSGAGAAEFDSDLNGGGSFGRPMRTFDEESPF